MNPDYYYNVGKQSVSQTIVYKQLKVGVGRVIYAGATESWFCVLTAV